MNSGEIDIPGSGRFGSDVILDNDSAYTTTVQFAPATEERLITFPDDDGTVGLVPGTSYQIPYCNPSYKFEGSTSLLFFPEYGLRTELPFGYYGEGTSSVTQLTAKTSAVTLNAPSGEIDLASSSISANSTVSFTLNNTYIDYGDVLVLNHLDGGSVGSYVLNAKCGFNNSATIYITNITSAALSEDFAIVYAIIKLNIPV